LEFCQFFIVQLKFFSGPINHSHLEENMKTEVKKPHPLSKIIDGAIAGMVGVTTTFPLDLAKTRLQNQNKLVGNQQIYKNLFQVLGGIYQKEGVRSWYKGFSVNFGMISFEKAIKLSFNDWFRSFLTSKEGVLSVPSQVVAGGLAGFFQSVVTTPMELLKIRMQVGEKNVISNIMKNGFVSFYRGWSATLLRDIPFSCCYFPIYSTLKDVQPFGGGPWWNFTSGLLSGASAGLMVTPCDVIKTRLQASTGEQVGWLKCATKIAQEEGLGAFFKGGVPRMIAIGSIFAVAQVMYELKVGDKLTKNL
jgi:solute carrier family 25 (mitochondrial glutamate transporter), member 18/22